MNPQAVSVKGTLKPDGALELDEKPNLPPGRVQVTLQVIANENNPGPDLWERLQQIWKDQDARGYKRRTREEIDAEIAADRADEDEYEKRWQEIWRQTGSPPPTGENP